MNKVSNENLRKALALRAAENYTDGFVYLKKACDEEDGVALALMGVAYKWGGWCVQKDKSKSNEYLEFSFKAGYEPAACLLSNHSLLEDRDSANPIRRAMGHRDFKTLYEYSKDDVCIASLGVVILMHKDIGCLDLAHLIALNDAHVNYYIARKGSYYSEREFLLKRSADQGFVASYDDLINEYYHNRMFDLAAPYVMKQGFGCVRMRSILSVPHGPPRLRELYLYGEYYSKMQFNDVDTKLVVLYKNTKEAVFKALIAWWIVAKRIRLYPDLRKLITQYVLKSAKDPSVWLSLSKEEEEEEGVSKKIKIK